MTTYLIIGIIVCVYFIIANNGEPANPWEVAGFIFLTVLFWPIALAVAIWEIVNRAR